MAKITNKTDHVIALMIDGIWNTIMPQGLSCKLVGDKSDPIIKDGIQFNPTRFERVVELPDRKRGTIIIVEKEVALFLSLVVILIGGMIGLIALGIWALDSWREGMGKWG